MVPPRVVQCTTYTTVHSGPEHFPNDKLSFLGVCCLLYNMARAQTYFSILDLQEDQRSTFFPPLLHFQGTN